MHWPHPLQPGRFIRRENRFRARIWLGGEQVPVHVPNSGRLSELFEDGKPVWVALKEEGKRKTVGDLLLVEHAGTLVSIDAHLPNRLVAEALAAGALAPFSGWPGIWPEVRVGHSRLDFLLTSTSEEEATPEIAESRPTAGAARRCWLETKSVTLVEQGVALFPDAPTARGVRHLEELARLRQQGDRAAVLFVVQRVDARAFAPHPAAHPAFLATLHRVHQQGVEIYAWRCQVDLEEITLGGSLPVLLDPTSC